MKKNIVFICTDQQRIDTLKTYDPKAKCQTPVLDALSEESMVFENAYTTCPVCSPARSSMQTGLYPSRTGLNTNTFQEGSRAHELADAPFLLSRRLRSLGYECAYTGKWHLGIGKDKNSAEGRGITEAWEKGHDMSVVPYLDYGTMPTDIGYVGDDFPGHGNGGWAYPQYREWLKDNGREIVIEDTTRKKLEGDHTTVGEVKSGVESTIEYFITDRAIGLTKEMVSTGKPFFMSLNFWGPHEPFFAPTEFLDMYRDIEIEPWKSFDEDAEKQPRILNLLRRGEKDWDFFADALRHYWASMSHIDYEIGRYFSYLKESGLWDDTIIIFTSDHGDYQGVHGHLENKGYGLYDDITKIPLIIKGEGRGRTKALVGTCDLYATVLAAAGYSPSDEYGYGDGRSLVPLMINPDSPWSDEIMTEATGVFNIIETERMYRKGKYKYVFYSSGSEQLFDMEADPLEMNNLVEDNSELLIDMRQSFSDYLRPRMSHMYAFYSKFYSLNEWSRKD